MIDPSQLTNDEAVKLALDFIQSDIEDAKDEIGTVCEDCLIGQILASFPASDRKGIAIGLSIACGFNEDADDDDSTAFHWLKHIVKLCEDDNVLEAESLEVKEG